MYNFQNVEILVFLGSAQMDGFQCRPPSYTRLSINPAVKTSVKDLAVIDLWGVFKESLSSLKDAKKIYATNAKVLNNQACSYVVRLC
jgi:hypothetical protein